MRMLKLITCMAAVWLLASTAIAQSPRTVKGVVVDDSGAAIPNARVRLLNTATGERVASTQADEAGQFELPAPATADYTLSVKAKGFEETRMRIKPGRALSGTIRVHLDVSEVAEKITVSAAAPATPSASENLDAVSMNEGFLRDMPLKGGDILEIAPLFTDPAVTGSGGTQLLVDGVETDALDLPESSIKEVVTNHSPFSAEFARPGKGRIEITTKKGSHHHLRGSVSTLVRNASLNARNTFDNVTPPHQRGASEAELDGPLGDKLAFTLASRYEFNNDNAVVNADTPGGPLVENVKIPDRFLHGFARLDYRTSQQHKTFLTYKFKNKLRRNQGTGGFDLAERGYNFFDHENELKLLDTLTSSAAWLNQFTLTLRRDRQDKNGVSDLPALLVLGAVDYGGAQVTTKQGESASHIEDSASYAHGNHTLRFGGGARLRFLDAANASNFGGTFSFSTLADYLSGHPFLFTQNIGDPRVNYTQHDFYSFIQDEVKVRDRLSVLFGLRYEFQSNVRYRRNFAPRVGLAYGLGPTTVFRVGGGIFYDRPPLTIRQQSLLYNGRIQQIVVADPAYPNPFADSAALSLVTPSTTSMASDLRLPYLVQSSVGLEQRLGSGPNYLTLEYTALRGLHLFRTRNINAPLPGTLTPINPNFVRIDQFESSGTSRGDSLVLTFKTFSRKHFDLLAQYTYSKTMDDTSVLNSRPANNWDLRGEWGRADYDMRHRFNLAASYRLPVGFRLGTILKFWSGAPYNIITGLDNNGDTIANDRPPGVGRNTGQGPGYADIDLRLAKDFRVKPEGRFEVRLGVDAFNLLNQVSYRTYVGDMSSPFFGQATQAMPARQLQVGLRTRF